MTGLLEVDRHDGMTTIRFPESGKYAVGDLGHVLRIHPDGTRTLIGKASGTLIVPDDLPLELVPLDLGVAASPDPLMNAPPDLFRSVATLRPVGRDKKTVLGGYPIDHDLWVLRHLAGLEELSIGLPFSGRRPAGWRLGENVTDTGLRYLVLMTRLRSLTLHCPHVTDQGLGYLSDLELEQLGVLDGHVTATAITPLLGPRTHQLWVRAPKGPLGAIDWTRVPRLRHLDLLYAGVTSADLEGFSELPLVTLNLSGNGSSERLPGGIGDGAAARLAGIPTLEELNLRRTDITNLTISALRDLPALHTLDLSATSVDDAGMATLAGYPALRRLSLDHTKVTAAGLRAISHLPLRTLSLCRTAIGADGLDVLASMPTLEEIHLSELDVPLEALGRLAHLPRLRKLVNYDLERKEQFAQVEALLPGVEIEGSGL